ncbi:MAG: hsp70 family protein [Verrucomicrobia bacterium]|nr:hsp70 family protein [Verrucomicrobiota bacterium]
MSASATHIVGIDLGTSNCAAAYARFAGEDAPVITDFPVPQLQRPGQVAAQALLPSCLYLPGPHELPAGANRLPWDDHPPFAVGEFARWQGARVPGRLVASAKSWLCHAGVDRSAAILPWGAPAEVSKVSPTQASAAFLAHVAAAWNHAHPEAPLARQEVVITVPASFDEVARALTATAARQAGLETFTLVEEPQAAFYDFTSRHREDLSDALAGVRLVLVVDVGGGTTDFTLISVAVGDDGPVLKRIAVGDHLMLGGDNMDAALARRAEERLTAAGHKLGATQWTQLVQVARSAKEALLAVTAPERHPLAIAGSGSRLIGSSLSTELTREEVEQLIVEGFFPFCAPDELPRRSGARMALQELGLPYAQDPAITRHLAAFLARHAAAAHAASSSPTSLPSKSLQSSPSFSSSKSSKSPTSSLPSALPRPDAILLNGGVFNAPRLAHRLVEVVSAWWPDCPRLPLLHHDSLDLAVARGAAAYGLARRGLGRRIGGGAAQALYVGLTSGGSEAAPQAVCVIPRGHEEGQTLDLTERPFQLTVGQPVQFPLFSTTADRVDRPGEIVAITEEFHPLPPLHTLLRAAHTKGRTVPVHLRATLTELGTLELWCVSNTADERWRLEFEIRAAATRAGTTVTESMPAAFSQVRDLVDRVFGPAPRTIESRDVKRLGDTLEAALGPREDWTVPLLRELWGTLFAGARRRRRSPVHERVFYRFVGYGLRPGFGYPLDEWRCEQTFGLLTENVHAHGEVSVWNEFWVMWRRIAGGLTPEHHQALWRMLEPHLARRVPPNAGKNAPRPKGIQPEGLEEMVRTAAALEHLEPAQKITLGNWIAARLQAPDLSPAGPWAWALGRLGARVPVFGSGHRTIDPDQAAGWLELLLARDLRSVDGAAFAAVQLARLTGDRTRDLEADLRARTVTALTTAKAPERWLRLVREVVALEADDQARALGDTLPLGLKL